MFRSEIQPINTINYLFKSLECPRQFDLRMEESLQTDLRFQDNLNHSADDELYSKEIFVQIPYSSPMRLQRRKARDAELIHQNKETNSHIVSPSIESS
jgi:hypothetical protein